MTEAPFARLRSNAVTWRELDEQIVVLDLDASVYLTVTGAGTVIWKQLVEGATIDQMLQALLEEFDVTVEVARADTQAFLDELRNRGLLA